MRLCVVLLLFGTAIATPITARQDLLGRYQQHSLHRLKRFSFWPFSRKKDSTTTSTSTTTTIEGIIPLEVVGTIGTPTSGANEVREEESSRGFWGSLNPFRGISNLVKKGYEKVKNSTVGQAIRNSSVGNAFRSGRNATSRGITMIGRTMRSGARSVGRAVMKIKRRLTGEEKYRYFVEQVRGGVERGDTNTLAMLDKLGINVTIDEKGVAHTVVRNDTPTATEILRSEGIFHHNTSGEPTSDRINGTSFLTDDSKGSGGPTAGEGWPITSTTSSPVTTISTTSTTTATSRTTTSVTTRAITSFPNPTLRTLSTTTTATKSFPLTITLHTTSWPINSSPTTFQPMNVPPKNVGRDTNIEQPLEECDQQWCDENAVTASENTTDIINTGDESASNETDTAETDEEVFNSISITEAVSSKLTPTDEHTLLTSSPGSHEIVNSTATNSVLLASNTSTSPDGAVFIVLLPEHNTNDFKETDTVMTATAKSSLSVVNTSTTESTISHLPVAFIPTSSPPSSSTLSPAATVNFVTTTETLPTITNSNNSTMIRPGTSTTEPTQEFTTQPTFVQTIPQDLTTTPTQKTSTTFTARSADSATHAVTIPTSPPTLAIVTITPTEPNVTSTPVVSSVTSPTVTSSTSSAFRSTTPLILTNPITSTTLTPITTTTVPTTSSLTTTTTTPPPTTMLVMISVTNSMPITTTTSSLPTTTVPTTIKPVTSLPTTAIPTTSKPTTHSPTTATLRPTAPPIPPSVTDTLAGAEVEQDIPDGNDGDFPSPFGPPTDAGFPSPFGSSGGDDEFPDVFNNKGVRDRLREIYEKGDFSHDDLRNAFNFDPNDYHYYYDYGN